MQFKMVCNVGCIYCVGVCVYVQNQSVVFRVVVGVGLCFCFVILAAGSIFFFFLFVF